MPGGAEDDLLGHLARVGDQCVVRGHQVGDVDEVLGQRGLSGAGVSTHGTTLARPAVRDQARGDAGSYGRSMTDATPRPSPAARTVDPARAAAHATELQRLHADPELLVLVNVWDVVTATAVAGTPGTRALATASHSIAASAGYPDGEVIPVEEMISAVGRIAASVDLPVSADLEAGYGDAGSTVSRAIDVGIVGANLEDQMKPLPDAVAAVEAAVAAGGSAGVPFVLNARTDAFLKAGDRDPADVLADAVARGRAYLDAGATTFFVPGRLDEAQVGVLVDALGPQKVNLIAVPGALPLARMQELGVARVSFGPWSQNVALTALTQLAESAYAGGALPEGTRKLN